MHVLCAVQRGLCVMPSKQPVGVMPMPRHACFLSTLQFMAIVVLKLVLLPLLMVGCSKLAGLSDMNGMTLLLITLSPLAATAFVLAVEYNKVRARKLLPDGVWYATPSFWHTKGRAILRGNVV